MKRKIILGLVVFIFLLGILIFCAQLLVGRGEDTWICDDGKWVKHEAPRSPMPQVGCR